MIPECQCAENRQECRQRTQSASPIVAPARDVARTERGLGPSIGDVTFLHVKGQRETASGPEYQVVYKIWLRADVGVPSDTLRVYRREIARKDRLATPRKRK
jgi:hypothetical protein